MECEKLAAESCLSTKPVSARETLSEKDVIRNNSKIDIDEHNRMQTEDLFVQAEDSCKSLENAISSESNVTSIANNTDFQTFLQMHDTALFSKEMSNFTITETIEDNIPVNVAEPRSTNAEDSKSTDSSYLQYDWHTAPRLLCAATKEYQSTNLYENFTKGCQWSPDGTCLLVPSEDCRMHIYELPVELYSGSVPFDFTKTNFTPALTVKEGGLIYDTCWYPFMNSREPITCCFLSTSKENPIHLWDAFTGELRATYRAYNQVDEVEASISVQFVDSGKEIWCGFKNVVRIFDTSRPGRQTNTIQFKHDFPNMSGLVSCIRENPAVPGLIAFGSYSKCIGLYQDGPLCTFKTGSGVTQVEFSSCGRKLFSAVRKNREFLCWDLRNPGVVLYSFEGRQSDTNQRIQFAITPEHIISGGTDGNVIAWELSESTECYYKDLNPKYKIILSKDCINGISLHRNLSILATSSGQRQCGIENKCRDNSVRLWWISSLNSNKNGSM